MQCSCPKCKSLSIKRNGYTRHGKQNHRCLDCGRQFSLDRLYISIEELELDEGDEPALQKHLAQLNH